MARQTSVVNLDPIDRKKPLGFFGRLLITTYHGGKSVVKPDAFGHYMFCGKQRGGKTASVLWYAQLLNSKYTNRRLFKFIKIPAKRIGYYDDNGDYKKFKTPPKVKVWSNFGVGIPFQKKDIFDLIDKLDPYANEVRIFLIDEFHTYFPKGSTSKEDKDTLANLTTVFSQLAKRNCYVLSTAQVYGRLEKALREQCLYMVDCHVNFNKRIVNEFILEAEILCDDLGRWAGNPKFIKVHGLSEMRYDTKRLIRS